jgi:hypothetical protein
MYDDGGDKKKAERIKVVETDDLSRGPLSGCIRLADSSRVLQRLKVTALEALLVTSLSTVVAVPHSRLLTYIFSGYNI